MKLSVALLAVAAFAQTTVSITAPDSHQTPAIVRTPAGKGPFPAIIFLHGGLETASAEMLQKAANSPTHQRFLETGWVVVTPTFRPRNQDPQTTDALVDCEGVFDYVAKMPKVDRRRIAIWGVSGGGSLALELAGERSPAAIIADEPASILMMGMFTKAFSHGRPMTAADAAAIMDQPSKYFTPELKNFTDDKLRKIHCPVLVVEGNIHPINRVNNEILFPEMKRLGTNFQVIYYPAQRHGLSMGNDPQTGKQFFDDAMRFLAAPPKPAAPATVTRPVVSEEAAPFQVVSIAAPDGHHTPAIVRKPPGKGPFPAVVYLHGGLQQASMDMLQKLAREANEERFLAAGWVVAVPTFRERAKDPQTTDALIDCQGVVDHVRHMPEVDPRSVVVWGTSGGGSLALELAGTSDLAAIIADEPASVLFTGIMKKGTTREQLTGMMNTPQKYWTPDLSKFTREKIARIHCPMFLVQGGVHPINRINNEIVIPELKAAGKDFRAKIYPSETHGMSRGNGTPQAAKEFFEDATRWLAPYLATKPMPLDTGLLKYVPAERNRGLMQ